MKHFSYVDYMSLKATSRKKMTFLGGYVIAMRESKERKRLEVLNHLCMEYFTVQCMENISRF